MKLKLYKKGGKLYCMQNGSLVPYLPKAQGGFQFNSAPNTDINQIANEQFGNRGNRRRSEDLNGVQKTYGDPNGSKFWSSAPQYAQMATAFATSMFDKDKNFDTGKYSGSVNNFMNNNEENNKLDAAIAQIPVYGQIIGAFKSIGTGMQKAIKNRDEYGISGSKSGEVFGNLVDPASHIQDSINIGKKYGAGAGWKNMATFGLSSQNLLKDAKDLAIGQQNFEQGRQAVGRTKGNYRNDSIYAKRGAHITTYPTYSNRPQPNVEIEDGEIVLGNPAATSYSGNAYPSLVSPFAAKYNGDKHGVDSDGDGMEGIPLKAQDGDYVGSDYLGLDGKRAGKNNPSVAKEMTPAVEFLNKADENSQDAYRNNQPAIEHHLRMLSEMKNKAEQGKFMEELGKMLKQKDRNLDQVLDYIANELPAEDMTPEQLQKVQSITQNLQSQMQLQQGAPNTEQMRNGGNMLDKYLDGGPKNPKRKTPAQLRAARERRIADRLYQLEAMRDTRPMEDRYKLNVNRPDGYDAFGTMKGNPAVALPMPITPPSPTDKSPLIIDQYQQGGKKQSKAERRRELAAMLFNPNPPVRDINISKPGIESYYTLPNAQAIQPVNTWGEGNDPLLAPASSNPFMSITPNDRIIDVQGRGSKMRRVPVSMPERQMGGLMPQEQQIPNESGDRMQELTGMAQQEMSYNEDGNNAVQAEIGNLSPQAQQMFQQLPPEAQEQVMQLPPDQREIAIMTMFEQMQGTDENQPDPQEDMMEGETGEEDMIAQEALNEQMVQRLGGYTNAYQGDKFRPSYQKGGDLFMSDPAAMNMKSAHLPRNNYSNNYNKQMGNHTNPETRFDFDHYQTGGGISDPVERLVAQYKQRGYLEDTAREMAKNKMNEYQNGGMTYGEHVGRNMKPGMRIRFRSGGKMHYGTVTNYDPKTGSFDIR